MDPPAGPPLYRDPKSVRMAWRHRAMFFAMPALFVPFIVFLPVMTPSLALFQIPLAVLLGLTFYMLGKLTFRGIRPLAVYGNGILFPEAPFVGFLVFEAMDWVYYDERRPWAGVRIGVITEDVWIIFPEHLSDPSAFFTAMQGKVERVEEDLEVRGYLNYLDAHPDGFRPVWRLGPRRRTSPIVLTTGIMVALFAFIFLAAEFRIPSLLASFAAMVGVLAAIVLLSGSRRKDVPETTLWADPEPRALFALIDSFFARSGITAVPGHRRTWRPRAMSRWSIPSSGLEVLLTRERGTHGLPDTWRLSVRPPPNGSVATDDLQRALTRFALEELLQPQ